MQHASPTILVLGSQGLLGRTVYRYLSGKYPKKIWRTTHKASDTKNSFLFLDVSTCNSDFKKIIKKVKKVDYVINCIGILKEYASIENLILVNSLFPHMLSRLAQEYDFRIIHISTDAVYSPSAGSVKETDTPSPQDAYGTSKLLGELYSSHSLTFRTSIIGFDPIHKKGLLEWVRGQRNKTILGFINQKWTGCTSLQFAKLCEDVIYRSKFNSLRKCSATYNFAPLKPITKYKLIKSYISLCNYPIVVKKSRSNTITRILTSCIFDLDYLKQYTYDIKQALAELIIFEN